MAWSLVAVGKLRPALRDVCDEYLKRLARWVPVVEREVREAGRAGSPALQRAAEGRHLLAAIASGTQVVLLDLDGQQWSSEALAVHVEQWRIDSRPRAVVIGGAAGVSADVRDAAHVTWSLGPLTLPHELARVIVAEQLYRASTILRGEPYHKGDR